jgi:DNA-directed RNA polymerase specialized sigma24 family protein
MNPIKRGSVDATDGKREDFEQEFLRCRGLLRLIAERVLGGDDDVEEAMQRSYEAAACQRRRFRSDGEFRRWLARTVLNEALMILHEQESVTEGSSELIFWQVC